MVKYCRIPGFDGAPPSEYAMGTYPNAEQECMNSGGTVVDRGNGCGSTTAAASHSDVDGSASASLAAAVVGPIRSLRDRLPASDLLRDFEIVNYAPDLIRMVREDALVRDRVRDAASMVSQFAFLALVEPQSETLQRSHYTEELHSWMVELADMLRARTDDPELRGAIDRLISSFEQRIGEPFGVLIGKEMRGPNSAETS